jgi:SAM-dependent methyltransferase
MNNTKTVKVDFDKELKAKPTGYSRALTQWYNIRASNKSHCNAYRNITRYIAEHICPEPFLVVDYGCGPGRLLGELAARFEETKFIGIDGSSAMLKTATRYLKKELPVFQRSIKLLHITLPSKLVLSKKADLITFTFPHMLSKLYHLELNSFLRFLTYSEIENAVILAENKRLKINDESMGQDELLKTLLVNRVVSKNIRSLLKRGGSCIRAEFANAKRQEFGKIFQKRYSFEEGSLEKSLSDRKLKQFFQFVHSEYHHSKVMEDVYEQTCDESDRKGGYWISLLRAI